MYGFGDLIELVLNIFSVLILARVLLSWIPLDTSNPTIDQIVRFIFTATEPVLKPIRQLLPAMPVDFSPLIVIVLISFISRLV